MGALFPWSKKRKEPQSSPRVREALADEVTADNEPTATLLKRLVVAPFGAPTDVLLEALDVLEASLSDTTPWPKVKRALFFEFIKRVDRPEFFGWSAYGGGWDDPEPTPPTRVLELLRVAMARKKTLMRGDNVADVKERFVEFTFMNLKDIRPSYPELVVYPGPIEDQEVVLNLIAAQIKIERPAIAEAIRMWQLERKSEELLEKIRGCFNWLEFREFLPSTIASDDDDDDELTQEEIDSLDDVYRGLIDIYSMPLLTDTFFIFDKVPLLGEMYQSAAPPELVDELTEAVRVIKELDDKRVRFGMEPIGEKISAVKFYLDEWRENAR